jgi:hypothetical protein
VHFLALPVPDETIVCTSRESETIFLMRFQVHGFIGGISIFGRLEHITEARLPFSLGATMSVSMGALDLLSWGFYSDYLHPSETPGYIAKRPEPGKGDYGPQLRGIANSSQMGRSRRTDG